MAGFVAWSIIAIARQEAHMLAFTSEADLPLAAKEAHAAVIVEFRRFWGMIGFVVFALSAITDWLDGFLAREWDATSRFGRLLDPIADKMIVGLPLLAIAASSDWSFAITLPAAIIVFRDVLITVLRFSGFDASAMTVTFLAKIKTFAEMIVIAIFFVLLAMLGPDYVLRDELTAFWLITLWLVAALSAYTGIKYLIAIANPPKPVAEEA